MKNNRYLKKFTLQAVSFYVPYVPMWFKFFLLFITTFPTVAQTTYPLQVNVNLLPPYSLYLSDYYSTTREKLVVTLINRDQLKPSVNVRLRMIITTPGGVRIQTNDNAFFQPVMVENGSPVRLTQDELAPYFQPSNFITQGYLTGGKLPEGMVEFCFQAVEAYTGQVLSASTCTRAWITSQKPPLLSLPRNNESIAFREPLNVLFQWTPLHQGLALVEYDFILKELWDNGMTPQAAFNYSPEIYRETTRSTSIIYGALQPALLPGKRYAWCVRAKAREGMDEVNLFQNDGYSEIRWFTLQDNCLPPEFVEASAERKRINLSWSTLPEHIGFTVSYRVKPTENSSLSSGEGWGEAEWKELQTQEAQAILYGLQSGATYEYRIASMCMAGQPVYTPIMQIVIPETDSARLAQCGILPDVYLTNQEPLKELKTGEEFKAGDFPITVVNISGSNGNFSGQGWTIIPWLNDAKVAVEFKNIIINTDHQMTNGYVEAKYDKTEGQIANLDGVFEGGYDVGKVKTGLTRTDTTFTFSIPGVESFALSDEGDLIITDSEGTQHSIGTTREGEGNEGNKVLVFPMTVQDKDGNVYQVEKTEETDSNGNTVEKIKATKLATIGAPLAADSFDATQLNGDKAIVTFTKGEGAYAFDTWEPYYEKILLIRDKYQQLYTGYYAPWKFLPAGQTDKVTATIKIEDNTIDPAKVIFKTPKGTEYKAEREGNTYTLQITSGPEGDVQELYALYPRDNGKYYTLGKLGIATYAQQHYEVVLVSVNGSPVDVNAINQTLKEIYEPVGVSWSVSNDDFSYTGNYRLMDNSTGLSTYNEAMRELNNAYKAARPTFNKKTNYLFFLKATGSEDINNRDFTGFMPRGAQCGYIFTSEIQESKIPVTVAHELGHGRWKLFHPFDKNYGGYDEAKQTTNLLAYGNGKHIAKWQWDIMNDMAWLVSVFEGDEKSAMSELFVTESSDLWEGIDVLGDPQTEYVFCFTPAGKIFVLPNTAKLNFVNHTIVPVPEGALTGYDLNGKQFEARYKQISGVWRFVGYFLKGSTTSRPEISFLTQEQLEAQISKGESINISTASFSAIDATWVFELSAEMLARHLESLALRGATTVRTVGKYTVITIALYTVFELFTSGSHFEYGEGVVVPELPLSSILYADWELPDGIPINLPFTAPVAIPHKLPKENGNCSVYVVFKVHKTSAKISIGKYGMTCQTNEDGTQCSDRPDSQCRFFNSTTDPYYENLIYRYEWCWVPFATDVSSKVARIVEKSLTGSYIIVNEGSLPPLHERPCFKRVTDFSDIEQVQERFKRIAEWFNEMKNTYGK